MGSTAAVPRLLEGPVSTIEAAIDLPSSKSLTNRALIAAAVADGGRIERPLDCEDTRLLADALRAAGWPLSWSTDEPHSTIVLGHRAQSSSKEEVEVSLGNSGTGSRFMLALLAAVPGRFVVTGSERLQERPMEPLITSLNRIGADLRSENGRLPVRIRGRGLAGGEIEIRPETSSQYVSALLLAAPLMTEGLALELKGAVPSRPYLDLTEDVLAKHGAMIRRDAGGRRWSVRGGGLSSSSLTIEGDWSAAAFFLAAAAVAGGSVRLGPLHLSSRQGDRKLCEVLGKAGLGIAQGERGEIEARGPADRPFSADLRDTPDLFPALATVACSIAPGSRLRGLENLKHKESDRLGVMVENLGRLGADLKVDGNVLVVRRGIRDAGAGSDRPRETASASQGSRGNQSVDGIPRCFAAADHRVAMAMAVAALRAGPVWIDDSQCVSKSFPEFWNAWEKVIR